MAPARVPFSPYKLVQFLYDTHVVAKACAIVGGLFVIAWINYDANGRDPEPYLRGGKIFFGAGSLIY